MKIEWSEMIPRSELEPWRAAVAELEAKIEKVRALREHVFEISRVDNTWIDVVKWDRVSAALAGGDA